MMGKALAFVLLSACAASALVVEKKAMTDTFFECTAPAQWESQRDDRLTTFSGPRGSENLAPVITVRYVLPGDPEKGDADAYLKRLTAKSDLDVPGWKTGPVTAATVAGRKARRVERDVSEFVPPNSMKTKEIPMKEIHLVVPAAKGWYLIVSYAPRSADAVQRKAFERFLKSFKPKL